MISEECGNEGDLRLLEDRGAPWKDPCAVYGRRSTHLCLLRGRGGTHGTIFGRPVAVTPETTAVMHFRKIKKKPPFRLLVLDIHARMLLPLRVSPSGSEASNFRAALM